MPAVWRIVKERYASTACSGEGAARTGGRWNSRGVWLIYTSGSQSLCALETLVHLNPPIPFRYVAIPIGVPDRLVEDLDPASLPADWREEPPPPSCQAVGDTWVRNGRSAVLKVPSVIVPSEANYLLNPTHPDFRKISIGRPEPFVFDPRLLS
jgi:RES domain-containing protein